MSPSIAWFALVQTVTYTGCDILSQFAIMAGSFSAVPEPGGYLVRFERLPREIFIDSE